MNNLYIDEKFIGQFEVQAGNLARKAFFESIMQDREKAPVGIMENSAIIPTSSTTNTNATITRTNEVQVKIATTNPLAKLPTYATSGSSCFDIYHYGSEFKRDPYELNSKIIISTGLYFEIPEGYQINIYSRSGHGINLGIHLANGTGKIDSDFRGQLIVCLTGPHKELVKFWDSLDSNSRIAQGEITPVLRAKWAKVELGDLEKTERGVGGIGSTGG